MNNIRLLIISLIVLSLSFSYSVFAQENNDSWAEQIILNYINENELKIIPGTIEYSNLMKGILLGEHPTLTNYGTSFIKTELEKDYIISYAAKHFNIINQPFFNIKETQPTKVSELLFIENVIQDSILSSNRLNAIEYAYNWSIDWGIKRNPDYPDFGAEDCTNFISQAVRAGGRSMSGSGDGCKDEESNVEWYTNQNYSPPFWCIGDYRDWEWSTSWSVPWPFRDYMSHQNYYAIEIGWTIDPYVAKYYLYPGDVIQLQLLDSNNNWVTYHTMIVTAEDYSILYMTYHSNEYGLDRVDRPLSEIPTGSSQRFVLLSILYPVNYISIILNSSTSILNETQTIETDFVEPYPAP